jgi:5'-nucleotidase
MVGQVVNRLAAVTWPDNTLMNVNIPNLPQEQLTGIRAAAQGQRPVGDNTVESADPRGRRIYWIGPNRNEDKVRPGTDIDVVLQGSVAIVPIHLDMTHQAGLDSLRKIFP